MKLGKVHCGTDISAMVTLHLQREVAGRLLAGARMATPAPAPNPMPYVGNGPAFNPPQSVYAANPDPYNGNPAPYNVAQAPPPIPHPRARASPPDFDFAIPNSNEDLRHDMDRAINTLRQYAQRIATLEKTVATLENQVAKITRERDMYKAGPIDMMNADMKKSASVSPGMFNYPAEGIEGLAAAAAAYPHPGPLTPRSQTQGGDEDGDGTYHPGN